METQLTYDNKSRHLGIRFRERYTTREGLQAKVREENWQRRERKKETRERVDERFLSFSRKKNIEGKHSAFSLPSSSSPSISSATTHPPSPTYPGHRRARHRHRRPRVLRSRREDMGPPLPDANAPWRLKRAVARQAARGRRRLLLLAAGRAARARVGGGLPPARATSCGSGLKGGAGAGHEDAGRRRRPGGSRSPKNLFDFSPWQQLRLAAGVDVRRRREGQGDEGPVFGGQGEQLVRRRGR